MSDAMMRALPKAGSALMVTEEGICMFRTASPEVSPVYYSSITMTFTGQPSAASRASASLSAVGWA